MPPTASRRADESLAPSPDNAELICPRCGRRFGTGARSLLCPLDGCLLVSEAEAAPGENDPMIGRVLGERFTITGRVGGGSMGAVYRAVQAPIGREVAVKILRQDKAIDDGSRARFLREARANSLLTSPHTVTVFDFGQADGGEFFLAMELLQGESLGQRIRRLGRLSVASALDTAHQALRSLAEAHAKGIIHRDLKPDNLFFARLPASAEHEEMVKVLDFGVAKMLHPDSEPLLSTVETQAGMVFGTPRYMSPEQAQGKPLDPRSDLYSLGVILYQMLTGVPPFADEDAVVVMARHIKTSPRPPSAVVPEARIPSGVESLVLRTLSKDPEWRPQSAETMMVEIARLREIASPWPSGVHPSLIGSVAASLAPPEAGPEAVADLPAGGDTLSLTSIVPPPASRRGMAATVASVAIVFAVIGLVAATHHQAADAAKPTSLPASPAPAAPASTSSSVAPGAADPGWTVAKPTTGAVGAAGPGASAMPATALPRSEPRPTRSGPPRGSPGPKTGSSPSVGYGYFE